MVGGLIQEAIRSRAKPKHRAKLLRAVDRVGVLPDVRSQFGLIALAHDPCRLVRDIAQRLQYYRPVAR